MTTRMDAMNLVKYEYSAACHKHPEWPSDPFRALAIVNEEALELTQAVNDGQIDAALIEAAQTAAVCIRFIEGVLAQKVSE